MIALLLAGMLLAPTTAAERQALDRQAADRSIADAAETVERYGQPTRAALQRQGFEGVRIYLSGGRGRPETVIQIGRTGRRPPTAVAVLPTGRGELPTLAGPVDEWRWTVAQAYIASAQAAPRLIPTWSVDEKGQEALMVCTDGQSSVIELFQPDSVAILTRDSCDEDPVFEGALAMVGLVADSVDGCRYLTARDATERLMLCAILDPADRPFAETLFKALDQRALHDPTEGAAEGIGLLLAPDVTVLSNGKAVVGRAAAADWWVNEVAARPDLSATVSRILVPNGDGRVLGQLSAYGPHDEAFVAPSEQLWRQDDQGRWKLVRWTIGAWRADELN